MGYSKLTFSKDPGMSVSPDVQVNIRYHSDLDYYFPSNVVKREQWGAKQWNKVNFKLKAICDVAFSRTGHEPCRTEEECSRIVKELQEEHLSQGFEDIKYNFLIGDDGKIYEGRGWIHKGEGIPDVPELERAEEQILHIGLISKPGMAYEEQVSMLKQLMRVSMNKGTLYWDYGIYLPD